MKDGKRWPRVLLPLLVWTLVWMLAAWRVGSPLLLPGPGSVLRRLVELAGTGRFWRSALTTLGRVFLGGALGAALGGGVAALSARFPAADWVLTPAMKVVRATPVASFILLIWLWARSAWVPVIIAALMSAPVVWSAALTALRTVDPKLLELAEVYRFGPWKTVRLVSWPSIRPAVLGGCRTALGLAWKAGVAAEALCRPRWALGTEVYDAKTGLETADLFAWTAAVVLLSFAVEALLWQLMERGERRGGT